MNDFQTSGPLLWSFGNCTLDERRLELTVDGELVDAEARPLELLAHLLRHAGELVTKDELLEAVWPGRIPSESVLTKTVAKLRQNLRDEDQAIVRTVYGQGYRLIAPVTVRRLPEALQQADPGFAPGMEAGARLPLRPHWVLAERLSNGGRNAIWLARHDKTGEPRVFKFARDADGLRALKREITVFRVLRKLPGAGRHLLEILDWNLEEPPYFIECPFVPGGSLAHWFEHGGAQAAPAVRLELVAQVADTLAAAHDAGVLHKDIKPGNVLVDIDAAGQPFARLADFGSGRLIDLERLAQLEITRLGFTQTMAQPEDSSGTPLYLAPELLAGQAPTLRSDIYALGVMLYQTVVGDFRRPLSPGWERDVADAVLCEDIASCADGDPLRRLADARELAQRLRGLEARRDQQTLAAAERAQSERLRTRLEQMRQRRPWLAASAALLVAGLAASLVLWLKADRANARATHEATLNAAVNRFLTDDLLSAADPMESGRRDVKVSELLTRASRQAATRFTDRPEEEAAVREAIGKAYGGLSDYDNAERELRRSMALFDGSAGARKRRDLVQLELIGMLTAAERVDEARTEAAALRARSPLAGDIDLELRTAEARMDLRAGNYDAAIAAMEAQRGQYRMLMHAQPDRTEAFLAQLGEAYSEAHRPKSAIALFQELLAQQEARYGKHDARLLRAMGGLGQAYLIADEAAQALPILEQGCSLARDVLGEEHDRALGICGELATVYDNLEKYELAEAQYLRTIAIMQRRFGGDYLNVRVLTANLGTMYGNAGRYEDALATLTPVYEATKRIDGESHPDTLNFALTVGACLSRLKRWKEASQLLDRTLRLARPALPADDFLLGLMQFRLAEAQGHLGQATQARVNFDEAIAFLQRVKGADNQWTRRAIETRDAVLGARAAHP